jgi:hypothetical protein
MTVRTGPAADSDGAGQGLGALGLRTAKWVLGVLVVSLVLPAVTKQWSDNEQQHQLKADLTSRLAAAVAGATTDGGFMLGSQIQFGKSQAETLPAFQNAVKNWKSEASAIDAEIAGYFATTSDPNKDNVVIAMRAYNTLVQDYLGFCTFFRYPGTRVRFLGDFELNVEKMREHLRGVPSSVVPPVVAQSEHGPIASDFREQAQNEWAQNIVNTSAPIIATVSRRQPRGLHIGAGAFFHQVFHPFG